MESSDEGIEEIVEKPKKNTEKVALRQQSLGLSTEVSTSAQVYKSMELLFRASWSQTRMKRRTTRMKMRRRRKKAKMMMNEGSATPLSL